MNAMMQLDQKKWKINSYFQLPIWAVTECIREQHPLLLNAGACAREKDESAGHFTVPSKFCQSPSVWAPSFHHRRRTRPCSVGLLAHHSYLGPSDGCLWRSGEPLERSSCAHHLLPLDCSCSSLLPCHLPWTSGKRCTQVPCPTEMLQNVGRSTGQSSWKPTWTNYAWGV